MTKQELSNLANEWTLSAKTDLKNKVINYMEETETSPTEVANELGISVSVINSILHGGDNIPLDAFAKIIIASGFAMELKPLNQTPFNTMDFSYDIDDEYNEEDEYEIDMTKNIPTYSQPTYSTRTPHQFSTSTTHEAIRNNIRTEAAARAAQDAYHHCAHNGQCTCGHNHHDTQATHSEMFDNPFNAKTIQQLKDIIEKNLWDTEIDIQSASRQELISFLCKKDKMRKAYTQRKTETTQDPKVGDFLNRIKSTVQTNPHLKSYLKNLLGENFND